MIIGNGMMAKQFASYKNNTDIVIFASGVSNSKETRQSEFERELYLLVNTINNYDSKHFVYFGTSSMYDPMCKNSPYVLHKLAMEKYIIENCKSYHIFRVSQVIGRASNPTLVNFIVDNIIHDKEFDVWERATRNLISLDDVYNLISFILANNLYYNRIVNIANTENISILDFIAIVESVINKRARIHRVPKGFPFEHIDISLIKPYLKELGISFNVSYYEKAVAKMIFTD